VALRARARVAATVEVAGAGAGAWAGEGEENGRRATEVEYLRRAATVWLPTVLVWKLVLLAVPVVMSVAISEALQVVVAAMVLVVLRWRASLRWTSLRWTSWWRLLRQ
jgi:hypothetical protein